MELGLTGRVALVTGGSKGIGKATARALAEEGVDVAICARGRDLLEQTAQEIAKATGRTILPVTGDMTKEEDAIAAVEGTVGHFGRLDILVNCAGASPGGILENLTEEHWDRAMNLKFMGYVRTTKAALRHMKEQHWGRVIQVNGNDGVKPIYSELTGTASNAAVINFTLAIAEEVGPYGITVNAINPGPTDTDRWKGLVRTRMEETGLSEDEVNERVTRSIPLGRICTPEEVANTVVFLASEAAGYITSALIPMDGAQQKALIHI
jgi:3-oxoacyl-[acyl-carrier protein] reductase